MPVVWVLLAVGLLALVAWQGSRWVLRACTLAVVLVAAVAVARVPSEEARQARPCAGADALAANGDEAAARAGYLGLLDRADFTGGYLDASRLRGPACAVRGLQTVLARELAGVPACEGAYRLLAAGARDEAVESFVRLLRRSDQGAHECAQAGLDRALRSLADQSTYDEVVVEGAGSLAARLTRALGAASVPGPVTWGVLLVASVLAYRGLEILNARRDPVPVAIAEVHSPADAGDAPGLAATGGGITIRTLLRDRLSRTGLISPSTIPGPTGDASGLLETIPLSGAGAIGKAAGFLLALAVPRRGVRLSATTLHRQRDPAHGLAVDVTDVRNGHPRMVRTLWGHDLDDAIDRTAYAVAQHAMDGCATLPPWTYWGDPDGQSLYSFERGRDALRDGDLDQAFRLFATAANEAPANALARLELAGIYESRGEFLPAIVIYLETARRHPQLLAARYRLAVALNFVANWTGTWSREPTLRRQVCDVLAIDEAAVAAQGPVPYFLDRAEAELDRLERDLGYPQLLRWCTRVAHRRHLWPLLVPAGASRRHLRSKYQTARVALHLRRASYHNKVHLVRGELDGLDSHGWQGRYNLACCHALLIDAPPPPGEDETAWQDANRPAAQAAVAHLRRAISDPRDPLPTEARSWLLSDDPDLAHLRRHTAFEDWRATFDFALTPPGSTAPRP